MTIDSRRRGELFRRLFRLPAELDEDEARSARFVAAVATVGGIAPLVGVAVALTEPRTQWLTAITLGAISGLCGTALWLVRRRAVAAAAWILMVAGIAGTTALVFAPPTQGFGDIAMMLFPVLVIAASVLLGPRQFVAGVGLILAVLGGILAAELSGAFGPRPVAAGTSFGFAVLIVSVSAVTSRLLANSLARSIARTRHNQRALAVANRRLEAEAAQRERLIRELEAKNAELERFTYTVSHDLKSPLVTIGGFLGYLERHAAAGDLDRFRSDLGRIEAARTRMARLLDELLELSRVGRLMNPPEDVPFAGVVAEARELAAGRLGQRRARVVVGDRLPVVRGDRARLVEVVQNLLDNAAKFTRGVPEPRVEIGVRDDGPEPVFFVRDNGVGIAPEYHEKVFRLFERLSPEDEGTGIGLALVKRIVETHGGRIWVESEGEGRGAAFCFTLPDREADPAVQGSSHEASTSSVLRSTNG